MNSKLCLKYKQYFKDKLHVETDFLPGWVGPYQVPGVWGEGEGEGVIAVDDIITTEDQVDLIEENNEEYHDKERMLLVAKTSS